MQTALLAGRAASRWATATVCSSSKSLPSFHRQFTISRPYLQEAEAAAPLPPRETTADSVDQSQAKTQTESPYKSHLDFIRRAPHNSTPAAGAMSPWTKPSRGKALAPRNPRNNVVTNNSLDPTLSDLFQIGAHTPQVTAEHPMDIKYRLGPVVGRTVDCHQFGPGSALAVLNARCTANGVRRDWRRQKFHERKGIKRKRLASERWRVRFKAGFKATCKRARALAAQGW